MGCQSTFRAWVETAARLRWLGCKHTPNLAVVGSSLLRAPGLLSKLSPLNRMFIK